jgi:hypothetical protein
MGIASVGRVRATCVCSERANGQFTTAPIAIERNPARFAGQRRDEVDGVERGGAALCIANDRGLAGREFRGDNGGVINHAGLAPSRVRGGTREPAGNFRGHVTPSRRDGTGTGQVDLFERHARRPGL